ncbi:unnamed protein product, partial [Didymodactylos carnosus]
HNLKIDWILLKGVFDRFTGKSGFGKLCYAKSLKNLE